MLDSVFAMLGTYEDRNVANSMRSNFELDTSLVTDRSWVYETAVSHKDFNNGDWIILEGADSEEDALKVHNKWLKKLSSGVTELQDCFTGEVFLH